MAARAPTSRPTPSTSGVCAAAKGWIRQGASPCPASLTAMGPSPAPLADLTSAPGCLRSGMSRPRMLRAALGEIRGHPVHAIRAVAPLRPAVVPVSVPQERTTADVIRGIRLEVDDLDVHRSLLSLEIRFGIRRGYAAFGARS